MRLGRGHLNLRTVQRLFSSFPSGPRGVGLLLLRAVLAIRLMGEGSRLIAAANHDGGFLLILGAGLVGAGVVTPVTQAVVLVLELARSAQLLWTSGLAMVAQDPWQTLIVEAAVAASLALLGPGAYSIDARLFGREEIIIPPRRQAPRRASSTPFVVEQVHLE